MQFKQFVVNGSIFSLGSKEYGTNTLILFFSLQLEVWFSMLIPNLPNHKKYKDK